MWSGNENLRNCFSGKPVLFRQADNTTAPQTIALDELIANFKAALASQNKQVIDAMWSGNENLRNWFSGKPVLFRQADNTTAPQTIALDELIANFKAALASRSIKVIDAMWSGNENLGSVEKFTPR